MRVILCIIKADVLERSRSYGEEYLTPSMCKSTLTLRGAREEAIFKQIELRLSHCYAFTSLRSNLTSSRSLEYSGI